MKSRSHTLEIYDYLKRNGSITPMEALREFGCYRLGARIYDLRKSGIRILTEMVSQMSKPGFLRRLRGEKPKLVQFARYNLQA